MRSAAAALLAGLLLHAATAQEPAAADGVLLRLADGTAVTAAGYRAHLQAVIGDARLEEYVVDLLLEREVERLGPVAVPAAAASVLAAPDAAAITRVRQRVTEQFGGDPARWQRYLQQTGRSESDEFATARVEVLRDARAQILVERRRTPDDALLRRLFEERYGVDGARVSIRHVLFSFAEARARLVAAHPDAPPPDEAAVDALAQREAAQAFARLAADAEFDALHPEPIPGYVYQRYGVAFADAVRETAVGAVHDPVRSDAGWHLVRVDARIVTRFDDVREELLALARTRPLTLAEWRSLRDDLLDRSGARAALEARRTRSR
ncbi:MAG: peptidyl-prolyl cis-trans isomerase [Planctomycetes bacterium]|nr:peptidyl-prolyl cis-trans isomerase [Planctomycetota bacterium]